MFSCLRNARVSVSVVLRPQVMAMRTKDSSDVSRRLPAISTRTDSIYAAGVVHNSVLNSRANCRSLTWIRSAKSATSQRPPIAACQAEVE